MNNFRVLTTVFILMTFGLNAQNRKAILSFKNGTTKEGLGKIHDKSFIKFRLDKKSKPALFHFAGLDSVKIYEKPEFVTYVYLKLSNKKEPKVVKQLQTGKVSLYYLITGQNASPRGFLGPSSSERKNIYVKRSEEDNATYLGAMGSLHKKFKKITTNYFKNCPDLIMKIENREFTSYDMRRIADYYNNNCIN